MIVRNKGGSILLLVMFFCAMLGVWSWHAWYRASVLHDSVLLNNAYYVRWYTLNAILDCCSVQVIKHHDSFIRKLQKNNTLEIDYSRFYHSFDLPKSRDTHQLFLDISLDANCSYHLVLNLELRNESQTLFSVGHTVQKKGSDVVFSDYYVRSG